MRSDRDASSSSTGAAAAARPSSSSQPSQPSALSRIISGSVGSVVYVLALTPLEVVKVRQQAAASPTSSFASPSSSSFLPASNFCGGPRRSSTAAPKAFLRGRGAVVLADGTVVPKSAFPCLVAARPRCRFESSLASLTSSASSLTTSSSYARPPAANSCRTVGLDGGIASGSGRGGIWGTLLSIARTEGRSGLYAGLRPTLLAAVPNTAIYFCAYDEISAGVRKGYFDDDGGGGGGEGGGGDSAWGGRACVPLVAGSVARLVATVATGEFASVRFCIRSAFFGYGNNLSHPVS